MIIAIEGGDTMGKATQSKLLAAKLDAVRFTLPFYETPAGQAILANLKEEWSARAALVPIANLPYVRRLLDARGLGNPDKAINAMVLQSLMMMNRLELMPEIKATLQEGKSIVFDRYTPSAIVYGATDGLDVQWVELINSSMPPADVCILLDGPVSTGFERRPERRDRYEKDHAFLQRVREEYLALFQRAPSRLARRWCVVDAIGTVDEVHERIMKIIEENRK